MGVINVTNVCGRKIEIINLEINGTKLIDSSFSDIRKKVKISDTATFSGFYDEKNWDDFSSFQMKLDYIGKKYYVNLNRDHFFYGSNYRYPGWGSESNFIISGIGDGDKNIQLNLCYGKSGDFSLTYSNDFKYLDLISAES
ncbi:hypothetical protein [Azospirillum thiophilum]|uniref:hypothetical protein n=1 Tax=Azospirillum thiophilum TaxID=528244 RepID=UPI000AFB574B|nr:hypothetical protein [Azospirillum thiophilum]